MAHNPTRLHLHRAQPEFCSTRPLEGGTSLTHGARINIRLEIMIVTGERFFQLRRVSRFDHISQDMPHAGRGFAPVRDLLLVQVKECSTYTLSS